LIQHSGFIAGSGKSDIYIHSHLVNLLTKPVYFGYNNNEYKEVFDKAFLLVMTWSNNINLLCYDSFIANKRESKLEKIL
jgi:hypothetical protein